MPAYFIATERFDTLSSGWQKYIAWSGLTQLEEVVSLDSSLCPTVLPDIKPEYWDYIVNEDFMVRYFTDFEYLSKEIAEIPVKNVLCVFQNPDDSNLQTPSGFEFIGYDLVERDTRISALSNCGGFRDAFSNAELSSRGLLISHSRAREVQEALRRHYPNEPHARCDLWAIFRLRAGSSAKGETIRQNL